ncbi:MAG: hypothetical protein ACON5B_09505 [Myxococcota bacterium]
MRSSDWLRRVWIRGDATSLGVMLGALAVAGVGAGLTGVTPVTTTWTVVLLVPSVALIRANQRAWARLLDEVRAAYATHDPGPSPVGWISDALWRARNRFDPVLDAPLALMAEVEPLRAKPGEERGPAISGPVLRPVATSERDLLDGPRIHAASTEAAEALLETLGSAPGRFLAAYPRWPVCCGELAMCHSLTGERPDKGVLYLPGDAVADSDCIGRSNGVHVFQCTVCKRWYVTDPAW